MLRKFLLVIALHPLPIWINQSPEIKGLPQLAKKGQQLELRFHGCLFQHVRLDSMPDFFQCVLHIYQHF